MEQTMKGHPNHFGTWLRQLRNQQDLTQERLAEMADCSVQAIRFWESGRRRPSLTMAEHLATILALPANQSDAFIQLARQPLTDDRALAQAEPQPAPPRTDPRSAVVSHLLPLQQTLIGREGERNVLCRLLVQERRRLVTVVGAGGMGKTHLALEVATASAPHFGDGVIFVPLAPLRTAAHLPVAVANALQLVASNDPSEQVLTALANRHSLVVLDNFEELLHQEEEAAASWVNRLLQQTTQLQILITSRERLRLGNEQIFELGGLTLPTNAVALEVSEAVLLFLARAQQVAPDFRLDAHNRAAIVRICQLVDGMPLGIELAAAWVGVLAPMEIADEIANNMDFLARSNRDTTTRHRSMRAVFEHSWALLDAAERELLGRLAVFRDGCTREAAQAVAGATLPLLASLIDKSLIQRRLNAHPARYDLHEVVRRFAAEKRRSAGDRLFDPSTEKTTLAQDEAWLAHYNYFYQLAAAAKAHLQGAEQLHWLQLLDEEHNNLRAALDRCLTTQDLARGLQLSLQLEEYWYIRGYHREGLQRLLQFLAQEAPGPTALDLANGFSAAAILAIAGGDYTHARIYLDRALENGRVLEDQSALARILRYRGLVAFHKANYHDAEEFAGEAVEIATAINNHYERATSLSHLAEIALIQDNYDRAQALGERAVQVLRMIGDKNQLAGSLRRLAQVRIQQGQLQAARQDALESLDLNNEVGDQRGTAASIVILASLLAATEHWSAAAQLLGAATALLTQAQATLLPADQLVYDAVLQRVTTLLVDVQPMVEIGRHLMAQQPTQPYDLTWIQQLVVTV